MLLLSALIAASSLSLVLANPVHNSRAIPTTQHKSVDLAPRQATISEGLAAFASYLWMDHFNKPGPCDNWYDTTITYYINTGQSANGLYWAACWRNDTETTPYNQAEADVVKCLAGLHNTQADTCISTAGSSCDINGYVGAGGRLQNLREPVFGSGYQSDAQISSDVLESMQEAMQSVTGALVTGLGGMGPYFVVNTQDDYQGYTPGSMPMQINWIGETAC